MILSSMARTIPAGSKKASSSSSAKNMKKASSSASSQVAKKSPAKKTVSPQKKIETKITKNVSSLPRLDITALGQKNRF